MNGSLLTTHIKYRTQNRYMFWLTRRMYGVTHLTNEPRLFQRDPIIDSVVTVALNIMAVLEITSQAIAGSRAKTNIKITFRYPKIADLPWICPLSAVNTIGFDRLHPFSLTRMAHQTDVKPLTCKIVFKGNRKLLI
jgi:hypothetical protein